MSANPPDHSQTNAFLQWLSEQWAFLSALVLGAGYAATAQAKLNEHEKKLSSQEMLGDRLARIETHIEHILDHISGDKR